MTLLTAITQIGGVLWILSLIIISTKSNHRGLKRFVCFTMLYLICTFWLVPSIAPFFGREKIQNNEYVSAHNFYPILLNRNYVKPQLNSLLQKTAANFQSEYPGIKIMYLDASFPFFDGFPLWPHLSHSDGKKIDISFFYKNQQEGITNEKPSVSGYGIFVNPVNGKSGMIDICKAKGYFQYDFSKYLTFGTTNEKLHFHVASTTFLIKLLASSKNTGKIFIEPHLKKRMELSNTKIRFHGCQAVRHDDHLHFQL